MTQKTLTTLLVLLIVAVIAIFGYRALVMPDQRTTGERMGDAVDAIGDGVDKAARELEDRSPAEKLGDAVDDAAKDIKENVAP